MKASKIKALIEGWRGLEWDSDTPEDILTDLERLLPGPRSRITRKRPDSRYTITQEYTGRRRPQWVVRFCGDFAGSRSTFDRAASLRDRLRTEREKSL